MFHPAGWQLTEHSVRRFRERYAPTADLSAAESELRDCLLKSAFQPSRIEAARWSNGTEQCLRCVTRDAKDAPLSFRIILSGAEPLARVITVLPAEFAPKDMTRHFKRLRRGSSYWDRTKRGESPPSMEEDDSA